MDITYSRKSPRIWVLDIWQGSMRVGGLTDPYGEQSLSLNEETLVEINQWCIDTFGYHARTAYNRFELRKKSHLNWFLLRWS